MKQFKTAFYFIAFAALLNACKKEYSIEQGGTTSVGTWQFNDSSQLFTGNMDSVYIDSTTSPNTKILYLIGTSLDGKQKFNLELYGNSFTTGTYNASLFQSTFSYTSGGSNVYLSNQLVGEFIVNITTLNSNNISGTFSGAARNAANNVIQLTQGKFTGSFVTNGNGNGVSSGVLGDSSGNCQPVVLNGIYSQGIAMDSSNTVQVQVTVATAGSYSIKTNTVNGIIFSKTGTFTSTGIQNVVLTASGTPTNSGVQNFTLVYGNSQCNFNINFAPPASGSLGGGGGSCTPFAIAGTYQQGILLNTTNTVQIEVNVTTPGNYNITTNAANGVVFSKSGTFTTTGVQNILLTGSGIPVNAGPQDFTVSFGNSNCTFNISFLQGVAPSGDYFPLTLNSNWTYGLTQGTTQDSIYSAVLGYAPTFGGNTYNTIAQYDVPPGEATDSAYFRKPGGDYYEYMNYSAFFGFDQPVTGEYIFLKDNVPMGTTWNSPDIMGTISGVPITVYIKMTMLEKAVPVTIGIFPFPNVIKMKYEFFVSGSPIALATAERWFAFNTGEIHTSITGGTEIISYDIGNFHIF